MVRPHNNLDFSLHHVVCRSHLASHLGHKQQAGIPFSNKPWRDRNQDLFSHPIRRVSSNGSAHAPAISRVFPKPVTSGPVIMVVTRAMITSMEQSLFVKKTDPQLAYGLGWRDHPFFGRSDGRVGFPQSSALRVIARTDRNGIIVFVLDSRVRLSILRNVRIAGEGWCSLS